MSLLDVALSYHRAGLTVLPNDADLKYPAGFRGWEAMPVTESDVRRWFGNGTNYAIGIRDQEGIDIDNKGGPDAAALLDRWSALVDQQAPGLIARLLCEKTPHGGYHFVWRCTEIEGNQKLATRPPTEAELKEQPKLIAVTLIETKGRGGQFQVAPSPGYTLLRGEWTALPEISAEERATLLTCARALTQTNSRTIKLIQRGTGERAGDRFNRESADEALALLVASGWSVAYERDGAYYLTRPGKKKGVSATFGYVAPGVLYVFTTNAAPFQNEKAYTPFAIYTELQHGGDYKAAARTLHQRYDGQTRVDIRTGEIVEASKAPLAREVSALTTPKNPTDINDLLAMERKPTIWYAQGFLREGLGLLVGQPNVGKTPLAAQLAIAMALGNKWMGHAETKQARVLYLGMEYSAQELIPLFDISRCGQTIPRGQLLIKTIEDEFPTTPEEAIAELEWYIRVLGIQVIIIDVLTAFLPPEKFKQNIYRGDYSELKPYHRLALQYNAAILGVWHASKRESDPRLMYNGSTGMWAAAASRITMYQDQEQRTRIASFARMADKIDWALAQEQHLAGRRWVVADANPEPVCSPTELSIYRCLKEHADKGRPFVAQTITDMTGVDVRTVRTILPRMFEKNLIQKARVGDGYYVETLVAPVAGVAGVVSIAPVADVASQQKATPETLRATDTKLSQSPKVPQQQEQRDSYSNSIFASVPESDAFHLRMYLRGNKDSDQETARERCEALGIDYDLAYKEVNNGSITSG